MSKNYANEHPKNKKKNQDSNVKVASSAAAQKRKFKLQQIFEGEVLMWESAHDKMMPLKDQDKLYKRLRLKVLGRSD